MLFCNIYLTTMSGAELTILDYGKLIKTIGAEIPDMGLFGGSRGRGQKKPAAHFLGQAQDRYEPAVLVDRRGPISRLPEPRPRRRDFDDPRR